MQYRSWEIIILLKYNKNKNIGQLRYRFQTNLGRFAHCKTVCDLTKFLLPYVFKYTVNYYGRAGSQLTFALLVPVNLPAPLRVSRGRAKVGARSFSTIRTVSVSGTFHYRRVGTEFRVRKGGTGASRRRWRRRRRRPRGRARNVRPRSSGRSAVVGGGSVDGL